MKAKAQRPSWQHWLRFYINFILSKVHLVRFGLCSRDRERPLNMKQSWWERKPALVLQQELQLTVIQEVELWIVHFILLNLWLKLTSISWPADKPCGFINNITDFRRWVNDSNDWFWWLGLLYLWLRSITNNLICKINKFKSLVPNCRCYQ